MGRQCTKPMGAHLLSFNLRSASVGSSRRFLLLAGAMALMLLRPIPAAAGIGDWWDIYSGAAETEIRRLNRQADVGLAWHQSRRLFEVQEALYFAIHGLKPPQIEALIANLDDPNRTLDDLRLPSKDGRHTLTARQTREQLGLPPDGLEREGIAVIRGFDRLVVYHDIERRRLVRFGQEDDSAELLLSTLQQDIRRNPPVPKHIQKADSQVRQHSPHLIKGGKMLWHHGAENEGCKPVLDRLPQTPTIGLCAVYMPTKSRRNERVGDCPGDQVGGVFETVHLLNGEESSRSKRWDDCVPKPPVEQSRFRWVGHPERTDCRNALYDARYALHAKGIRDYRISGQYREERKEWTYREDFPPEWSLPPLVLTWNDPWIVKQDTCLLSWDTAGSENGTYRVGRCTQDRRRSLTYHWQQSRTSGRRPANPAVTRGRWRNVGGLDCPWNYWTTSETESASHKVNGCTQRRQRTVTSYWRQSTRPGSTKQLRYKTHGSWRDVGRPNCPRSVGSSAVHYQYRTIAVGSCKQRQKRKVTRFYLTRADGTQEAGFPYSAFGRYTNVGGLFDCPKPVASTTVSTQTRRTCHQTTQESRHTSAQYTLFTYNRTVTHHWLTYADGRREAGNPPFTLGPWGRGRRGGSCRPGGGGGGNNSGEYPGYTYDTTGDGKTDSYSRGTGWKDYGGAIGGIGTDTGSGLGRDRGGRGGGSGSAGGGYNSGDSGGGGDPWGGLR